MTIVAVAFVIVIFTLLALMRRWILQRRRLERNSRRNR